MVKKLVSRKKKRELIIAGFNDEVYEVMSDEWRCRLCDINFKAGNLAHITRHINTKSHKLQSTLRNELRTLSAQLKRAENRNDNQQEFMKGALGKITTSVNATLANTEALMETRQSKLRPRGGITKDDENYN